MKQKKQKKIKQPQIGGAAAATWEHHLTDEAKEQLGEEYGDLLKRNYDIGRKFVLSIVAVNLLFAVISIFLNFNIVALIVQILLSVVLFFVVPASRGIFIVGVAVIIFASHGGLTIQEGYSILRFIFTALNTFFLAISAILLLTNANISDYLYTKRYG